jgi:hypothetical protein
MVTKVCLESLVHLRAGLVGVGTPDDGHSYRLPAYLTLLHLVY